MENIGGSRVFIFIIHYYVGFAGPFSDFKIEDTFSSQHLFTIDACIFGVVSSTHQDSCMRAKESSCVVNALQQKEDLHYIT